MDRATGATRPRAALEPAELADLLLPFVDKPSFIDYGDDLKKSTVQVEKFNNHMWKAVLDRCPSPAFKQSVVVSALLIIRDKMDKWKMPEHKTRRWAATFAQRFRTQAKHLMNGLRQNSKWALRIKNGGNKKPTFQDPHAEEVDMGDEGEEGDHDDHDMEDALSAGEGSSDDCAGGDDAPYEETEVDEALDTAPAASWGRRAPSAEFVGFQQWEYYHVPANMGKNEHGQEKINVVVWLGWK